MDNTTPRAQAFLKLIWPTVYRIINGGLYFILNFTKNSIKAIYQQVTRW